MIKYFDAMSAGNVDEVRTLFTPEAMPSETTLSAFNKLFGMGMIKYEDIKLKTLNQTSTDAKVQIVDVTIRVTAGDQTVTQKLSKIYSSTNITIKLKKVNGVWLIDQKGWPGNFSIPSSPG